LSTCLDQRKNFETFRSMKGYLCVALAALMWASSGTAGKALFNSGVTPFELVQLRVTVSTVLLGIVFGIRFRPLFRIRPRDLWYFFLLGGVLMALVQFTYFYTISKIQVAAAIFIQYLAPIMVAFFSICFWKECLTLTKFVALILSLGGCYLVVGGIQLSPVKNESVGNSFGPCIGSLFCGIYPGG
jgi:drug/metabolite transporter (DMT)-like permease